MRDGSRLRWLLALGAMVALSAGPGCATMRYRASLPDLRPCTEGYAETADGWRLGMRHVRPATSDPGKLPVVLCHGLGLNGTFWTITDNHLAEQLAAAELTTPGKIPDVYLQRGDTFSQLAKGASVNFWLTFHAAADAPAAEPHRGKIHIEVGGKPATDIDLSLNARPFALAPARAAFGMYFSENHNYRNRGSYFAGDELIAVFRDMVAHEQNSIAVHGGGDFEQALGPLDLGVIALFGHRYKAVDLTTKARRTRRL